MCIGSTRIYRADYDVLSARMAIFSDVFNHIDDHDHDDYDENDENERESFRVIFSKIFSFDDIRKQFEKDITTCKLLVIVFFRHFHHVETNFSHIVRVLFRGLSYKQILLVDTLELSDILTVVLKSISFFFVRGDRIATHAYLGLAGPLVDLGMKVLALNTVSLRLSSEREWNKIFYTDRVSILNGGGPLDICKQVLFTTMVYFICVCMCRKSTDSHTDDSIECILSAYSTGKASGLKALWMILQWLSKCFLCMVFGTSVMTGVTGGIRMMNEYYNGSSCYTLCTK